MPEFLVGIESSPAPRIPQTRLLSEVTGFNQRDATEALIRLQDKVNQAMRRLNDPDATYVILPPVADHKYSQLAYTAVITYSIPADAAE